MRDLFIEVIESVRRNKLRTALTGFAVSWGIFMLILLLGLGNGLRNSTEANMGDVSANVMEVWGGWTSEPYDGLKQGRRINIEESDLKLTESDLFSNNIDDVTATLSSNGVTLAYEKRHLSTSMTGVSAAYFEMEKYEIVAGRLLNSKDDKGLRKVIILSTRDVENLLDGSTDYSSIIGKRVKAGNLAFQVVGVYKAQSSMMGSNSFIPYSTLKATYNKGKYIDQIIFSFHGIKDEKANEAFEDKYRRVLNANHRSAPSDRSAIGIWNRFTTSMMMDKGMGLLNIGLWIIGIFTLLSGIVGVSNIMLITVKERTHEFGIRKAIGASPWALIKLIIAESVSITGVFGYLGMFFGMVACEIASSILGNSQMSVLGEQVSGIVNPTVGLDVAIEATILLIVAGTIAGLVPARKAAKIRPIEALMAN